jgi:hypothetical protein
MLDRKKYNCEIICARSTVSELAKIRENYIYKCFHTHNSRYCRQNRSQLTTDYLEIGLRFFFFLRKTYCWINYVYPANVLYAFRSDWKGANGLQICTYALRNVCSVIVVQLLLARSCCTYCKHSCR